MWCESAQQVIDHIVCSSSQTCISAVRHNAREKKTFWVFTTWEKSIQWSNYCLQFTNVLGGTSCGKYLTLCFYRPSIDHWMRKKLHIQLVIGNPAQWPKEVMEVKRLSFEMELTSIALFSPQLLIVKLSVQSGSGCVAAGPRVGAFTGGCWEGLSCWLLTHPLVIRLHVQTNKTHSTAAPVGLHWAWHYIQ